MATRGARSSPCSRPTPPWGEPRATSHGLAAGSPRSSSPAPPSSRCGSSAKRTTQGPSRATGSTARTSPRTRLRSPAPRTPSTEPGDDRDDEVRRHERTQRRRGERGREDRGPRPPAGGRGRDPGHDERQQHMGQGGWGATAAKTVQEDRAGGPRQGEAGAQPGAAGDHPPGQVGTDRGQRHRGEEQPGQGHRRGRPPGGDGREALDEPRESGQQAHPGADLRPGAEAGAVPGVAPQVPESGGGGGEGLELAPDEAGPLGVEQTCRHGGAEGGDGQSGRHQGGEGAGVGGDALREGGRQHGEVLGLLGHRAGLDRGRRRRRADAPRALEDDRLLKGVPGVGEGGARADEDRVEVTAAHGAPAAVAPPRPDPAHRVCQGTQVAELHPGMGGALEREERGGTDDTAHRHPGGEDGGRPPGAPGESDPPRGPTGGGPPDDEPAGRAVAAGSASPSASAPAPSASAAGWTTPPGRPRRTRAAGATTTRWPASWARHPRSRPAPSSPRSASRPPSSARTSVRTSMPGSPTARTSVRWSYCPWSGSPCEGVSSRRPALVTWSPSSTSRRGWSQSASLGPTMPAVREPRAAPSRPASASGRGAVLLRSSHHHVVVVGGRPAAGGVLPGGLGDGARQRRQRALVGVPGPQDAGVGHSAVQRVVGAGSARPRRRSLRRHDDQEPVGASPGWRGGRGCRRAGHPRRRGRGRQRRGGRLGQPGPGWSPPRAGGRWSSRESGAPGALRPRASSACGAPAPTARPRCRSARRGRGRTPGTRPAPRTRRRPSWPPGWSRPSQGRTPPGPSGRRASAPARRARPRAPGPVMMSISSCTASSSTLLSPALVSRSLTSPVVLVLLVYWFPLVLRVVLGGSLGDPAVLFDRL